MEDDIACFVAPPRCISASYHHPLSCVSIKTLFPLPSSTINCCISRFCLSTGVGSPMLARLCQANKTRCLFSKSSVAEQSILCCWTHLYTETRGIENYVGYVGDSATDRIIPKFCSSKRPTGFH